MIFSRRKDKRKIVKGCILEYTSNGYTHKGKMLNISKSGIGVELEKEPEMNDILDLVMTYKNGGKLSKKAEVVWFIKKIEPEKGAMAGLRFI